MLLKSVLAAIVLSLFTMSFPKETKAWSEYGHLTICDTAYREFTPHTRDVLRELFQINQGGITVPRRGSTPERHYTSFNLGCLEEDVRPRRNSKDHFLNVDRSTTAIESELCPVSEVSGQPLKCILSGIRRDLAILKDESQSRQDRVMALMAIGHWVGDIHQPLHVSYKDDAGGNGIRVSWSGFCGLTASGNRRRPSSLHAVWDNCLLEESIFRRVRERDDFKTTWGPRTITYRAVDTIIANKSLANVREWTSTEPWQWAAESYEIAIALQTEYCVFKEGACWYSDEKEELERNATTSQKKRVVVRGAYIRANKGVAAKRVAQAGFRLAHLVNQALDPNYVEPT